MKCKIFHARSWQALEMGVNGWLETHAIDILNTQYSTVYGQDEIEHLMFHTLILFYIPRVDEGEEKAFQVAAQAEREIELYLESGGHTENAESYRDFLENTVDDSEYNAYLEYIHTPRAEDY